MMVGCCAFIMSPRLAAIHNLCVYKVSYNLVPRMAGPSGNHQLTFLFLPLRCTPDKRSAETRIVLYRSSFHFSWPAIYPPMLPHDKCGSLAGLCPDSMGTDHV